MPSEFIEELDQIFCTLAYRVDEGATLTRDEQVVVDIYGAMGHIAGDGIHQFWDGTEHGDRVLEDDQGQYLFDPKEKAQLSKAQSRVYSLFRGLPTSLLAFCKERNIS